MARRKQVKKRTQCAKRKAVRKKVKKTKTPAKRKRNTKLVNQQGKGLFSVLIPLLATVISSAVAAS